MKAPLILAILLVVFAAATVHAVACTQTQSMGLGATVTNADLIIIGQKTATGPLQQVNDGTEQLPAWTNLQVLQVWKGNPTGAQIRVKTNTPCGYGFPSPADDNNYLLFLNYDRSTGEYDRVSQGTALGETLFLINDRAFDYYDTTSKAWTNSTLTAFAANYNLHSFAPPTNQGPATAPNPAQNKTKNPSAYANPLTKYIPLSKETIIVAVILAVLLGVIIAWYASTARLS